MKSVAFVLLSVVLIDRPSAAATFVTLPPVPGLPSNSSPRYSGIDGNNVVGYYADASGTYGFLYNGSGYVRLDDPLSANSTLANGISGKNIVGGYHDASNRLHGFLFDGTSYHTIDYPGIVGDCVLTAISGNKIVGYYTEALSAFSHSFIYNGSTFTPLDDPSAANGLGTAATSISGNKVVGNYFDAAGVVRSFLFDGANFSDLNYPPTSATFANGIDGDNIVGSFHRTTDPPTPLPSFLYNQLTQTWTELDYPGAFSTNAYGISGNMIVGNYQPLFGTGPVFGFIATVPEPSSLILLAIAGLIFAGLARARRAKRVLV